ncbi:hypothetical protein EC845_3480 [Comamonas sp. BIGb0124]|uniref:DUF2845 domain-containing protein n=1 Tax=Comamonas sp. BIGb0124 TaxID=2485130 RepID=UPI000F97E215|nr:DUF2845 domain-containing protein [Comamonas sp. BIGb0124]ROR18506.1 hypothetical protein EC845_3480 [Comamonas sp. BIGb0124]
MARKSSKVQGTLIAAAAVIGLPIYGASKVIDSSGWAIPLLAMLGLVVAIALYKYNKKHKRLTYLRGKYKDETTVQKIYAGYFWEGQTAEQLLDSLGRPESVDNKLLKTKIKEVWKYNRQGVNRYGLRITVENGHVAGWDKKS